jgi:hypothetical protein
VRLEPELPVPSPNEQEEDNEEEDASLPGGSEALLLLSIHPLELQGGGHQQS